LYGGKRKTGKPMLHKIFVRTLHQLKISINVPVLLLHTLKRNPVPLPDYSGGEQSNINGEFA